MHETYAPLVNITFSLHDHRAVVHFKKKKLANAWALGSSGDVPESEGGVGNCIIYAINTDPLHKVTIILKEISFNCGNGGNDVFTSEISPLQTCTSA